MAELYLLQLKTYFIPSPGETFTIIKIMILIYIPCLPRRPLEEKSYKSAAGQTAAAAAAGPGLVSRVWPGLLLHQGNWGLAHLYTG